MNRALRGNNPSMAVIRTLARPLLASIFVIGGVDVLRHPDSRVAPAEKIVRPLAEKWPALKDTRQLVQLDAGVKVVAGLLLASGRFPRLSSLALAGSLVPTTLAAHRYWEVEDPQQRAAQKIHFFKNVSMLGGLIISSVDTGGKPDLVWRTQHTAKLLDKKVTSASESVKDAVESVKGAVEAKLP